MSDLNISKDQRKKKQRPCYNILYKWWTCSCLMNLGRILSYKLGMNGLRLIFMWSKSVFGRIVCNPWFKSMQFSSCRSSNSNEPSLIFIFHVNFTKSIYSAEWHSQSAIFICVKKSACELYQLQRSVKYIDFSNYSKLSIENLYLKVIMIEYHNKGIYQYTWPGTLVCVLIKSVLTVK